MLTWKQKKYWLKDKKKKAKGKNQQITQKKKTIRLPFNGKNNELIDVANKYVAELRNNPTKEESLLITFLENTNAKYVFQEPIFVTDYKFYIVDFYFPYDKIAIELDGYKHFTRQGKRYDKERDYLIERTGVRIVRIPNNEITDDFLYVYNLLNTYKLL